MKEKNMNDTNGKTFNITANLGNGDEQLIVETLPDTTEKMQEFRILLDDAEIGIIKKVDSDIQGWEWTSGTLDQFNADEVGDKIDLFFEK